MNRTGQYRLRSRRSSTASKSCGLTDGARDTEVAIAPDLRQQRL